MISFSYNNNRYKAAVVKSGLGIRTDYAVRPTDPSIVRKFGRQTLVFRENGQFNCDALIDAQFPDYVDALVNAIRDQDKYEN